ncbi:LOB domain-containing protein 17-like [Miscanthus floridulus]|uniref:LOB domain-containing protein 17-like n=1 Tax=Miscanthus floridulus TaxID=154761 RepID=UPI003457EE33
MVAASSSASSAERGSAGYKREGELRRARTRAEEEMPDDEEQAVAGAPCGACRTLWRRCVPGYVFAPYFTADDFAAVHGVFVASNVSKMLERIELPEQRRVPVATLVEGAKARQRDPTFGCVSYIRIL